MPKHLFIQYSLVQVKKKSFPAPLAYRAAPISVSIALGHASMNAVKATAWDWSTGSFVSLTFPLHSHMSKARREGSEYHFKSLWYDSDGARTPDLPFVRQTLYHWAITPVISSRTCIILITHCINQRIYSNNQLFLFCLCFIA